jgi:sugar lactone lactonase YvrE
MAGGVYRYRAVGGRAEVSTVIQSRRGIGGLVEHASGGLVVTGRNLIHQLPDATCRVLAEPTGGTGFNDISTLPDGRVLAGQLNYRPLSGEQPRPGALVLIGPLGRVEHLTDAITWPNGIGVTPNTEWIYVSDYAHHRVLAVSLTGMGTEVFAVSPRGSADGLAVDIEGGVWVALGEGGGIARFHNDGTLDGIVDLPADFVSSLCFGGTDGRDVIITTADNRVKPELGGTLLRARSSIAGLPVAKAAI